MAEWWAVRCSGTAVGFQESGLDIIVDRERNKVRSSGTTMRFQEFGLWNGGQR